MAIMNVVFNYPSSYPYTDRVKCGRTAVLAFNYDNKGKEQSVKDLV